MATLTMFDAISVASLPSGSGYCYAGYVDGQWQTAAGIRVRFPRSRLLTIAVSAASDADALDIETGDATPADAAAWFERQKRRGVERPCLYANASTMHADVVPVMQAAGIPRSSVRLWSAHYDGKHICGPSSCGQVSIEMDGTQWTDTAMGRDLDQSLLVADFFGTPPAPKPKPAPKPAPKGWTARMIADLPTLKQGDVDRPGEFWHVHRLQALLAVVGTAKGISDAAGLAPDGDFGGRTQAATRAIQAAYGLPVTGTSVPAVWSVLLTGSAG